MDKFESYIKHLPVEKGNYILCFQIQETIKVMIGSLGKQVFPDGQYIYTGSALGPGGIRARLKHHLKPSPKPHWHMDYLKPHVEWISIGWMVTDVRLECIWAQQLILYGAETPIRHFGASDCKQKCPAHLLMLNKMDKNVWKILGIQDSLSLINQRFD